MILSILTPTIPARAAQLAALSAEISAQISAADASLLVEHRIDDEPPPRSIGAKRDRLMRTARGKYVACCRSGSKNASISACYYEHRRAL